MREFKACGSGDQYSGQTDCETSNPCLAPQNVTKLQLYRMQTLIIERVYSLHSGFDQATMVLVGDVTLSDRCPVSVSVSSDSLFLGAHGLISDAVWWRQSPGISASCFLCKVPHTLWGWEFCCTSADEVRLIVLRSPILIGHCS